MGRKEEIRIYEEQEDIEADYDRFREEWTFDAETQRGEHQSGLQVQKVFFGRGVKMRYDNLQEWGQKLEEEGLTPEEVNLYRRMLKNQFYILCEKNPQPQHELSLEERVKEIEAIDKHTLIFAKEKGYSEEVLQKITEDLNKNRLYRAKMAEVFKNGNQQSNR